MEIVERASQGAAHVSPGEQNLYVVNGAVHFGLRPSPASLIFCCGGRGRLY